MIRKAPDADYFLEIAEYLDAFLSQKHSEKTLRKINMFREQDSINYKSAFKNTEQVCETLKNRLWTLIDSEEALSSDQTLTGLRNRYQGLTDGNIIPLDTTVEFLQVHEDVLQRLDDLKVTYDQSLKQTLRETFRAYDVSKKQFENKRRVSVWNSFDELLRVGYFVTSDLTEFNGRPLDKLGAMVFKGRFSQVIDKTKPLDPQVRAEYDRHVDRLTGYVNEQTESKSKTTLSAIKGVIETLTVLITFTFAVSPLVSQWIQSPLFPYSREIATASAIILAIYVLVKYREQIIAFLKLKFRRFASYFPSHNPIGSN